MNDAKRETSVCGLLPWYVAGTLDADEEQQVHRHLRDCSRCAGDLPVLEAAREEMHRAPVPIVPEPDLAGFHRRIATGHAGDGIRHTGREQSVRVARAVALVAGVVVLATAVGLWVAFAVVDDSPGIYETASDGAVTSVEGFVFEVDLAPGVTFAEGRQRMEQAGALSVSLVGQGRLAVVFAAPAATFADVEITRTRLLEDDAVARVRLRSVEPADPVR